MMVLFQGTGGTVTRDGLASNQLTALGGRLPGAGPRSAKILGPWANPGPRSLLYLSDAPFAPCCCPPRRVGDGLGSASRGFRERASRRQTPRRVTFRFYLFAALALYDSNLMTQQGNFPSCVSLKTMSKSGFSTGSRAGSTTFFSFQRRNLFCSVLSSTAATPHMWPSKVQVG